MGLSTGVGVLKLKIWYGLDPGTGRWGSPMRQRCGLSPHQEMSPALEDKLAFTVTATRSYEEAALVAQKWNCPVDDSTLHALARRLAGRITDSCCDPAIPASAIWFSLLFGAVFKTPSFLQLQSETRREATLATTNKLLKRNKAFRRNQMSGLLALNIDANEHFKSRSRCAVRSACNARSRSKTPRARRK